MKSSNLGKKEEIYLYSKLVRDAIDSIELKNLSAQFHRFPKGSCGAATDVLGTYLDELGYKPIYRVLKNSRIPQQNHSHTWLEYKNLLIDITADQFNDHPEIGGVFGFKNKVIVTENGSQWYEVFDYDMGPLDKREAHYRLYDEFGDDHTARLIERDYLKLLNSIPKEYWPEKRNRLTK